MLISNLNLNHLRIFESVYRTRSMTKAANELHMTQSGVSQHIKLLEDILEVSLFDRIKQRLIPTQKADVLFDGCSRSLYELQKVLNTIVDVSSELTGTIRIGMPVEFGNNIILPLLADFGKKFPMLKFQIKYGLAPEMNDLLLKGDLDFAFVDQYGLDKQIESITIFEETLVLCASPGYIKNKGKISDDKKFYANLEYVDYLEESMILSMWFKHHFKFKMPGLNIRATLLEVQGVAQLIKNEFGAGILPLHVIKKFEAQGHKFHVFKGSGIPLKNAISLAQLSGKSKSLAVERTFEYVKDKIKNI